MKKHDNFRDVNNYSNETSEGACTAHYIEVPSNLSSMMVIMAFPVVEFSREGYKIRKVFG